MAEPDPGLEHTVLGDSSISWIDGEHGGLVYRGFAIEELVPGADYESVVHLLLFHDPPDTSPPESLVRDLASRRALEPSIERLIDRLPPGLSYLDALRTVFSAMSDAQRAYPPTVAIGLDLIAKAPTALARIVRRAGRKKPVAPRSELAHVANYLWMLEGREPSVARVAGLESYFDLLADHGMNASTLALRVVLSTQADLFSAATAAMAALKGPAHGGAPARVTTMLDEIREPERAVSWIAEALQRKERLYGFGHRAYKAEDPRSRILKRIARDVATAERYALAEAVESAALEALERQRPGRRLYTNVEFYGAVVLEGVGLPPPLFTPTFALARTAGWTAHALEQTVDNRLIRPDVRYIGPPPGRRWPRRGENK